MTAAVAALMMTTLTVTALTSARTAAADGPAMHKGCAIFPPDNAWNTPVDALFEALWRGGGIGCNHSLVFTCADAASTAKQRVYADGGANRVYDAYSDDESRRR